MAESTYPADWKLEWVTPAPKIANPKGINDLRKISSTSDVGVSRTVSGGCVGVIAASTAGVGITSTLSGGSGVLSTVVTAAGVGGLSTTSSGVINNTTGMLGVTDNTTILSNIILVQVTVDYQERCL